MIVTCEACGTSYKVRSSQIRPSGSKVRCSKCQHVFVAYPPLQEPETEKPLQNKTEAGVSEADYSNVNTSTFLADAAETEKQLDAFFAEDFESETDFDAGPESSSSDPGQEQSQEPEFDDEAEDFLDFDFQDLSTDDSEQILMKDLEYDEELSLSDLEADADLDISELGFDQYMDFPESDESADVELSDLEAGTKLPDAEAEEDFDISELEFDADQIASDVKGSTHDFSLDTMQETFDLDLNASFESDQQDQKLALDELSSNFSEATMGLPELETEADLDLSDLEKDTADLDISDLEAEAVFDELEVEQSADLDLSDLEAVDIPSEAEHGAEADLDLSDLEKDTADLDISDLEAEAVFDELEAEQSADLDLSDLEAEDVPAASDIMEYEEESLIEIQEEDSESEPDVSDFYQKDSQDAFDLMDSEEAVEKPEDIPKSEEEEDVFFEGVDQEFDLDFDDSDDSGSPESGRQDDAINLGGDLFDALSDSEEDNVSDIEDVIEEEEVSLETVHEEFDLDLDTFELNLEDEEGYLDDQDYDSGSEIPGRKEINAGVADMEKDGKQPGKTEDLFELDLDFDLIESTQDASSEAATEDELDLDFGTQEFEESEQSDAGPAKPESMAGIIPEDKADSPQSVYEVNLELGQDDDNGEGDDFLLDLDLDFDETPDEQVLAEKEEENQPELPLDLSLGAKGSETSEKDSEYEDDSEPDLDLDLELEDATFGAQEADKQMDEKEPVSGARQAAAGELSDQEDSSQDTDLGLDLDLDLDEDSGAGSTQDEDFELDLETMFEDSDESEDSEEVLLESADGISDQAEPRQQQEVESKSMQKGPQARQEPPVFAGVTDDTEDFGETRSDEDAYDDDATIFEKAVPPQAMPRSAGKNRKWGIAAVIIVLAAAVGIAAYLYFYGLGKSGPEVVDAGNLKIAVSDPSYRFIDNQHAGELLVVTGSATNRYDHIRKNILMEGGLHDEQGSLLAQSSAVCGNTLLPEQLQSFEVDRLRQRLGQKAGDEHRIPVAGPGNTLPFMMVFSDPPEGIAELSVRALSSERAE